MRNIIQLGLGAPLEQDFVNENAISEAQRCVRVFNFSNSAQCYVCERARVCMSVSVTVCVFICE